MQYCNCGNNELQDYGPYPFVFNLKQAAVSNTNYRTALWTGKHLQLTLMSIPLNGDIGAEMHDNLDQFIGVAEGRAKVYYGTRKDTLLLHATAEKNYGIFVPAGTWHNVVNAGNRPLKLYSFYAPPNHPFGTVQKTQIDAEKEDY